MAVARVSKKDDVRLLPFPVLVGPRGRGRQPISARVLWTLVVVMLVVALLCVLFFGTGSGRTVDQQARLDAQAKAASSASLASSARAQGNDTVAVLSVNGVGTPISRMLVQWMDLFVFLVVLMFIIGVIVKLGGRYRL